MLDMGRRLPTLVVWLVMVGMGLTPSIAASLVTPAGSWRIVISGAPSATESFAAEELQRYVKLLTGLECPVEKEPRDAQGFTFHVGRTTAALPLLPRLDHAVMDIRADSYLVDRRIDRCVFLGGGDRGTLYAIYDFLERQGCRWFQPGPEGEWVPRVKGLDLPVGLQVQRPAFAVREIGFGGEKTDAENVALIDWAVKNRLNRIYALQPERSRVVAVREAWERRGGAVFWQHICHNTPWMVPNETYFDTHPEYYSLYRGERIPIGSEKGYLCTTHPDVMSLCTEFVRKWFRDFLHGSAVPVCPPDGAVKWCECPRCIALGGRNDAVGEEARVTRRQVAFLNGVARGVAAEFPDRYVVNLAYSRYVWPYDGMRLEPNTITQVAHGYAGNGFLNHPITADCNAEARKVFREWAESGTGGIGVWDYFLLQIPGLNGSELTPLGFGNVAAAMIRFLNQFENPYKVYFTQAGNALQKSNVFLYYAVARLAWRPETSLEALRRDYARHVFGPAWQSVDAYLAALDETYESAAWYPDIWRKLTVPSPKVFTPAFITKAELLLNEADAALDASHSRERDALARLRRSLDFAACSVAPKLLSGAGDTVWRLDRGRDAYRFNANADTGSMGSLSNWIARAERAGVLDDSLARTLFRCLPREEPIVTIGNDRVQVAILPGVGGRILRPIDRQSRVNLFDEPLARSELEDPGVDYFHYGGYEEYTQAAFASAGWETPMTCRIVTGRGGQVEARLVGRVGELELERTVRIPGGTIGRVEIFSNLRNGGDTPVRATLRTHPVFSLGRSLEDLQMVCPSPDGFAMRGLVGAALDNGSAGRHAVWLAGASRGVVHTFDTSLATPSIHLDHEHQTFNLELTSPTRELAPGESLQVRQTFGVLSGEKELAGALTRPEL